MNRSKLLILAAAIGSGVAGVAVTDSLTAGLAAVNAVLGAAKFLSERGDRQDDSPDQRQGSTHQDDIDQDSTHQNDDHAAPEDVDRKS